MFTLALDWKSIWALLLLAFLVSLGVWRPTYIRECPHDLVDRENRKALEDFTGGRDDIPEYNDCQKLMTGSSAAPRYGPLAAIFAGGEVPEVHVVPASLPGDTQVAHAVAVIRSWGDYNPLGIRTGYNCLFLQAAGDDWRAHMMPVGHTLDCSGAARSEFGPKVLRVTVVDRRPDGSPYGPGDVPLAARWGFDQQTWRQYAIVKCGIAICAIGEAAPPPPDLRAELTAINAHVNSGSVKYDAAVWHDEQFLAAKPSPNLIVGFWNGSWLAQLSGWKFSGLQPASPRIWGAAVPDDSLGQRGLEDFRRGWIPVARVALSRESSDYVNKMNFGSSRGVELNLVEACIDIGGNCEGLDSAAMDGRCASIDEKARNRTNGTSDKWRARHTNMQTGEQRHFCIDFYGLDPDDADLVVPGMVRLRWEGDEKLWFRCPAGCCTPES